MHNTSQHIKIIIAGGGTGGHIFPAVAIANACKKNFINCEILFVGALGKMEMEKVPKEGYNIIGLPIAGFNRSSMLKNITLPFKIVNSFLKARKIIKNFKPNIAIGVGGYASLPVLYMAQKMKVPTLIQEQNSFAGKSNIKLGKQAKSICVAYPNMQLFFPEHKITITGNPVRSLIVNNTCIKNEALAFFKLQQNKKTILVIGGSLGAKSINDTLIAQYQQLLDTDAQIIWQTGKPLFEAATKATLNNIEQVKVFDFIQRMDMAYAAADVVISRSGALSVSELCISAKPVVFVPYPHAAEDHQTTNAMALVNINAAVMVADADTKNNLISTTIALLNDENKQHTFAANLKKIAIADADERIVNELKKIMAQ
jgi:UDP-N-acetylglucosamine--N-acetylmuramyl-(pentapeptide) pyrophosphoryl-undecaprenol N-acetylglucosamine transferase